MTTELDRAERAVEERSVALKKPLGLRDLVLTQILFVVGSSLGRRRGETRAGASLLLAAGDFAFLHSAGRGRHLSESTDAARRRHLSMGKARLQRVRRFHRGLEPLAAFDHRDRARRNVRHHEHLLRDRPRRGLDAEQQMVRVADQLRTGGRPGLDLRFAVCR